MTTTTSYLSEEKPVRKTNWQNIIVYSVILSAFIPKLVITEGVNIFLPELFMFVGLVFGFKQFILYSEQRLLLGIFLCMVLFSIISQASVVDFGAILRSVKEIIYIPIIYWASKIRNTQKVLKNLVLFGCVALLINILMYMMNFSVANTIFSDAETLSSGMSNRGIDIFSLKLVQLNGLAHGIWGSYCVLIFTLAISLKQSGVIKRKHLYIVGALFFINIVITVSREAILILVVVYTLSFLRSKKSILKRGWILVVFAIIITGIVIFGSDLPAVQKISYTIDSFSNNGSESNISLRINTWAAYFNFLSHNVQYILFGLGFSPVNFYNHISPYTHADIVNVPESAVVYCQAYGGIIATICLLSLIAAAAFKINKNSPYKLIKYFFIGVIITNCVSGVSMFSDLLYAHLCVVYGLLIVNNNEDKSNTVNSQG